MYMPKRDNLRGKIKKRQSSINSIDDELLTIITPLPYTHDIDLVQPRRSFTTHLQRSSYLFPKSLSNPRMNSFGNAPDERATTLPLPDSIVGKENNYCSGSGSGKPGYQPIAAVSSSATSEARSTKTTTKAAVRFDDSLIAVHTLADVPRASDMTAKKKSNVWYDSNECDRFKYQAAKQAGVKIVRYDSAMGGAGHHFVMCGDFDMQHTSSKPSGDGATTNKDGSSTTKGTESAAAADCNNDTDNNKLYYNENEYSDRTIRNSRGETVMIICKRGLGYHFSRSRKKSRIVARSAVVAWQKTLRGDPSNASNGKAPDELPSGVRSDGGAPGRQEKATMMLALVSTKCSRTAREEARWRGDVDFRVAYPERHVPNKSNNALKSETGDRNGLDVRAKKRSGRAPASGECDDAASAVHGHTKNKRRRRNVSTVGHGPANCGGAGGGRDGRADDGMRSSTTIGYLAKGVLHAEV